MYFDILKELIHEGAIDMRKVIDQGTAVRHILEEAVIEVYDIERIERVGGFDPLHASSLYILFMALLEGEDGNNDTIEPIIRFYGELSSQILRRNYSDSQSS